MHRERGVQCEAWSNPIFHGSSTSILRVLHGRWRLAARTRVKSPARVMKSLDGWDWTVRGFQHQQHQRRPRIIYLFFY
jgi:hypothetical protein